jgi:hypothetical protein
MANSSCHQANLIYNSQVRSKRNLVWLGMLAALALNCAGCGGFTGKESVSPATFLLPGILKTETLACTNMVATVPFDTAKHPDPIEITSVR